MKRLPLLALLLISAGVECGDRPARAQSSPGAVHTETRGEVSGYTDSDNVSVLTPALGATVKDSTRGWSADGNFLVDIVTAASVDIVSTASPRWTEVRYAGGLGLAYQPSDWGVTASASASREPDYTSLTGGGSFSIALDEKHITPRVGYAFTRDEAGRSGTPFSTYSLVLRRHTLQLSSAFVVNRSTQLTLLGDVLLENGRQEKPYRYLPLFDTSVVGEVRAGESINRVNDLRLPGRAAERLPTDRQRYALAARIAWRGQHDTLSAYSRGYLDSWGLLAGTVETRWLHDWQGGEQDFWTRARGHVQGGVSFWERAYVGSVGATTSLPSLRTGDRELGPLWGGSVGVGYRIWLGAKNTGWRLGVQLDGGYTRFSDALFIEERWSAFGAVQVEKRF